MPEEVIDNIEEAGGYPYQVRERLLAHMRAEAEEETAKSIALYERHYAGVKLNWESKGKKLSMPQLPIAVSVDEPNAQYTFSTPPGYPKPAPWETDPEVVWGSEDPQFGPPIPGTDAYYVTGAGGKAGDTKVREGQTYRLIVVGERGHIVYLRMWVPV